MTDTCETCRFRYVATLGWIECAFAPDGFIERTRTECRRYPPVKTFMGWSYPIANRRCGEHRESGE